MKSFLFPTEQAYKRHFTALAIALFFGGLLFLFESRADEIFFSLFGLLIGWTLFSFRTGFIFAIIFYLLVWLSLK
ncbi:MAG: hypothetical protein RMK75_08030 [Aquificaceae bacterium]|nr:hypothetical protein [Aquificaceae bacterium]MDW8424249.1 hypothetical protein [Aquificaceae bacterium]